MLILAGLPPPLLLLLLLAPAAAISPPTFHPPLHLCLFTHLFVPAPATWLCLLGLCLAFVHAHFVPTSLFGHRSGLFVLIHAIWDMGGGSLHAPQPLVYVYIKHYKLVNT